MTGHYGHCGVGADLAAETREKIKEEAPEVLEWLDGDEHIKFVTDHHGCARPCSVGNLYTSDAERHSAVCIFFFEEPPKMVLDYLKKRAIEYAGGDRLHFGGKGPRDIQILGFKLTTHKVTIEQTTIDF